MDVQGKVVVNDRSCSDGAGVRRAAHRLIRLGERACVRGLRPCQTDAPLEGCLYEGEHCHQNLVIELTFGLVLASALLDFRVIDPATIVALVIMRMRCLVLASTVDIVNSIASVRLPDSTSDVSA